MRIEGGWARLALTEGRTMMMNCGTERCGDGRSRIWCDLRWRICDGVEKRGVRVRGTASLNVKFRRLPVVDKGAEQRRRRQQSSSVVGGWMVNGRGSNWGAEVPRTGIIGRARKEMLVCETTGSGSEWERVGVGVGVGLGLGVGDFAGLDSSVG